MNSNFHKQLQWRYATKQFDKTKKVSDSDMNDIIESNRLAPSSYGLQPWKLVMVKDEKLRQKLRENAYDQPQVTDASHFFVICARTDVNEAYVKGYIKLIADTRGQAAEQLKGYEDMMLNWRKNLSDEGVLDWSKRQAYIGLGFLLYTCALKGIDACPMEGFDNNKFNEILDLNKEHLASVAMCAVGYRSADDKYAQAKKVRFDAKDLVVVK